MGKEPEQLETVIITQAEYDELKGSQAFLIELEAAGVDNWDGYHYAYRAFCGEDEEW
jgi:hypothetical protein